MRAENDCSQIKSTATLIKCPTHSQLWMFKEKLVQAGQSSMIISLIRLPLCFILLPIIW